MKNARTAAVLLLIVLIVAPLTGLLTGSPLPAVTPSQQTSSQDGAADIAALLSVIYESEVSSGAVSGSGVQEAGREAGYKVLRSQTGEVVTLSPKDYLRGCVAAEMPLEYADEALKAQIVAAHTYAVSYKLRQLAAPSPELKGADISDDPSIGQAYIDDAELARRYEDNYAEMTVRINGLIDEVIDYIMMYEGEPVVAAYHAISAGKTESAQNIWGAYSPYLVSVDSSADKTAPDYLSTVKIPLAEMKSLLQSAGVTPSGLAKTWFSSLLKTPSGYVSAVKFGDKSLSGAELRALLGLRSTCFSVSYSADQFVFTVQGWGHGVGMSQYGAECLAQKGKSYSDILKTYYKGVSFCEL